jgi:hypothetical protein
MKKLAVSFWRERWNALAGGVLAVVVFVLERLIEWTMK